MSDTRTPDVLHNIAVMLNCDQCWAYPGRECIIFPQGEGPHPLHLGRYERGNRKGLITSEELALARSHKGEGNYVIWPPERSGDAGTATTATDPS